MKVKDYIICGLLAAILAVCCFTSYAVIQEQKKQSEIQTIQAKAILQICEQVENEETGLGKSMYYDIIIDLGNKLNELKEN